MRIIKPQPGPQEAFLSCSADIAIYGGAAGGGKTYALLMEPLRYMYVSGYRAVIFRKNYTQISASGGLWDTSQELYAGLKGAVSSVSPKYHWTFNGKASLVFDFLGREEDVNKWQGSQITFIGFDELTHFTMRQFFYMLSRNRSTCGVRPYVRCTCNPDADSWVSDFISWWIDQDTGYPIPERSGRIRYMTRTGQQILWGDTRQDLIELGVSADSIKSVTFISSTLADNKALLEKDPGYLANLKTLPEVDRERLLSGNWLIRPHAGLFFKRTQVRMVEETPDDLTMVCRGWDLAATDQTENEEAAYTAGVLIGRTREGRFIILDVINQQLQAGEVRSLVLMTAEMDRKRYGAICPVRIRIPQDPGQAGKEQALSYQRMLAGYAVRILPESGDKATRAEPMAALWQRGGFDILTAPWNEEYLNELESFPQGKWKDMVDAGSNAFSELTFGRDTLTGAQVYVQLSEAFLRDPMDNAYTITPESAKAQSARYGDLSIGLHFGVNGSGLAIVASTEMDRYGSLRVLRSVRYAGDNLTMEAVSARVLAFVQEIRRTYGPVHGIYYDRSERVLPAILRTLLTRNGLGDIRLRPCLDTAEIDRINLINRLAAGERITIAVKDCGSLTDAIVAASWQDIGTRTTRCSNATTDNDSLLALEYSCERGMVRYLRSGE